MAAVRNEPNRSAPGAGAGDPRRKLLRDIGGTFGAKLLLLPIGLVSSIIVARALQPEGKGIYTTALTFADLVLALGTLGVGKAALFHIGRAKGRGTGIRQTALWLSLGNGVLLSLVLLGSAFLIAPRWLADVPAAAILLTVPVGVLSLLRGTWEGFLRGEQRNNEVNLIALAFSAFLLAGFVLLGALGWLHWDGAIALRVLAMAVATWLTLRILGFARSGAALRGVNLKVAKSLLGYGLPYAAIALLQNTSYRCDVLLIQGFLGNSSVGHYSIATTLGELLWYLPAAIGFVLFPRTAAMDRASAGRETAALCRWALGLTACGAIGLGLVAEPLIQTLYGTAYLPAAGPLRLLLVGIVANTWYAVLSGYLLGQGQLRNLAGAALVGAALNVALNLALIPRLGLDGAALASSVAYAVTSLITVTVFRAHAGVPFRDVFLPGRQEIASRTRRLLAGFGMTVRDGRRF